MKLSTVSKNADFSAIKKVIDENIKDPRLFDYFMNLIVLLLTNTKISKILKETSSGSEKIKRIDLIDLVEGNDKMHEYLSIRPIGMLSALYIFSLSFK